MNREELLNILRQASKANSDHPFKTITFELADGTTYTMNVEDIGAKSNSGLALVFVELKENHQKITGFSAMPNKGFWGVVRSMASQLAQLKEVPTIEIYKNLLARELFENPKDAFYLLQEMKREREESQAMNEKVTFSDFNTH